jgi:hypothetical protein
MANAAGALAGLGQEATHTRSIISPPFLLFLDSCRDGRANSKVESLELSADQSHPDNAQAILDGCHAGLVADKMSQKVSHEHGVFHRNI